MKSRICVYLTEKAAARLMVEAQRRGVTKSFIVRAALDQLLGECPESGTHAGESGTMMRRLNWMSRQLEQLDRDLRVVNETVALHARYHLAVTPPLPTQVRQAACKLGSARFDEFAAQVGRRVHLGMPLMRETMERVSETSPHLFTTRHDVPLDPPSADHDAGDHSPAIITSEPSAAVREDGSNSGFPEQTGNHAA
jgi:hypothetical protein